MQDWRKLFADGDFRRYWLALCCYDLGTWCVIATLPILVAHEFGDGGALVLTMLARVLPRIVLAPIAGIALRRLGPIRVASRAIVAAGLITAVLPWCDNFVVMEAAVFAIGMLDVFINPALLLLLSPVTPDGLGVAANTLFVSADRLAKLAGPAFGGLLFLVGGRPAFGLIGAMIAIAALVLPRLADGLVSYETTGRGVVREFASMLRTDPILRGLLICAVPYLLTLGGTRPFLFWANAMWFGGSDASWTLLLSALGGGAIMGALLSGFFSKAALRLMSVYELTLVTSLLEGLCHPVMLMAPNEATMAVLLALSGMPEMLAYATYIACVQQRLPRHRQAVFYSLQQPLFDATFVLGVASAGLHTSGLLSLGAWWGLLSVFSTVPPLMLLVMHAWVRRVEPAPARRAG